MPFGQLQLGQLVVELDLHPHELAKHSATRRKSKIGEYVVEVQLGGRSPTPQKN
jgi:hypothetical protein